jgi:hypothetical protein
VDTASGGKWTLAFSLVWLYKPVLLPERTLFSPSGQPTYVKDHTASRLPALPLFLSASLLEPGHILLIEEWGVAAVNRKDQPIINPLMHDLLLLNYTSAVATMIIHFPDAEDYGLFSMEFANQHIKQASSIRMAALHLHIAARSRTVAVKERLLEQMVELAYCPDVEDSLYLAPLDWLFVDQPPFMKAKELR